LTAILPIDKVILIVFYTCLLLARYEVLVQHTKWTLNYSSVRRWCHWIDYL